MKSREQTTNARSFRLHFRHTLKNTLRYNSRPATLTRSIYSFSRSVPCTSPNTGNSLRRRPETVTMGSSPNTGRNTSLGPGPGPTTLTALTGSSSSQPNTTEAQRLLSKYRRIASDRAAERGYAAGEVAGEAIWYSKSIGLPEKEYVSVLQLRKAVLGVIVERLKARQIPSQRLTEMNLSWCLPQT
jgi:hypothetical protein